MATKGKSNWYRLMLTLGGVYLFTNIYNIIYFHQSGLGSMVGGDLESIKDNYRSKFDDDLASKLHSSVEKVNDQKIIITTHTDIGNKKSESNQEATSKDEAKVDPSQSNEEKSSYRYERNVFKKMSERSSHDGETCQNLHPDHLGQAKEKDFDTGVPPLPENGVHEVLNAWLDGGDTDRGDYPMCELPPTKSCNVSQYSLILMSHTVEDQKRLRKLKNGIEDFAVRSETAEIILVWNSEKEVLINSDKKEAQSLVEWDQDESHPLRIFYSLDNGLGNNLLNRYHPMIKPKQEAIMYFDDDGPFYEEGPMQAGFNLWKFNSDVQIGSLTRNIRYPSKRMNDVQTKATELSAIHYRTNSWHIRTHPYDTEAVKREMTKSSPYETEPGYPQFTPICRDETGDNVEYNYYVFPNYKAHMSLPSGSILHRNYLCFVWHPVFNELRQFILDHPTHPDDMTISTLVSHLSGKPLRTFPRYFKDSKRRLEAVVEETNDQNYNEVEQYEGYAETKEDVPADQLRRRLLWQQKDWGNMREEAINSILGYFGSINPGSVGWCAGSEYEKAATGRGNMVFNCEPEFPSGHHMIPWMNKGGLGYDECPKEQ